MSSPPPMLAFLAYHWGDAYLLTYTQNKWVALRRGTRDFLVADTLTELETSINADYWRRPVSRDIDPGTGTP